MSPPSAGGVSWAGLYINDLLIVLQPEAGLKYM